MIPNLIPVTNLRSHIAKITGVLVSQYKIQQWIKSGEIKICVLPGTDRRKKFISGRELMRFIEEHSQEEDTIEGELKIYLK